MSFWRRPPRFIQHMLGPEPILEGRKHYHTEMDGPERMKRRIGTEAPPLQPISGSTSADEVQLRGRLTATDATQQQERHGAPLMNDDEEEHGNDQDRWLVVNEGSLYSTGSDAWSVMGALCGRWCRVLDDGAARGTTQSSGVSCWKRSAAAGLGKIDIAIGPARCLLPSESRR